MEDPRQVGIPSTQIQIDIDHTRRNRDRWSGIVQSAGSLIGFIGVLNIVRHISIALTYNFVWVLISLVEDLAYVYVGYQGFKAGKNADEDQIAKYYKCIRFLAIYQVLAVFITMLFVNGGLWFLKDFWSEMDDDVYYNEEMWQEDRDTWKFVVLIAILVSLIVLILNIAICSCWVFLAYRYKYLNSELLQLQIQIQDYEPQSIVFQQPGQPVSSYSAYQPQFSITETPQNDTS